VKDEGEGFTRRRSSILKWKVFKKKILNSEEFDISER
jgi:hypothetical protein